MEILVVGRSRPSVGLVDRGLMRNALTLVWWTLSLFIRGTRMRMSEFSLVHICLFIGLISWIYYYNLFFTSIDSYILLVTLKAAFKPTLSVVNCYASRLFTSATTCPPGASMCPTGETGWCIWDAVIKDIQQKADILEFVFAKFQLNQPCFF